MNRIIPIIGTRTGETVIIAVDRAPPPRNVVDNAARIISVSEDLRDETRTVRLRGEVVAETRNARGDVESVRIRTDRGEIEIRPAPDTPPPKTGQSVEIEIRPHTTAPSIQPEDITSDQASIKPQAPALRDTATPVDVDIEHSPQNIIRYALQAFAKQLAVIMPMQDIAAGLGAVVTLSPLTLQTITAQAQITLNPAAQPVLLTDVLRAIATPAMLSLPEGAPAADILKVLNETLDGQILQMPEIKAEKPAIEGGFLRGLLTSAGLMEDAEFTGPSKTVPLSAPVALPPQQEPTLEGLITKMMQVQMPAIALENYPKAQDALQNLIGLLRQEFAQISGQTVQIAPPDFSVQRAIIIGYEPQSHTPIIALLPSTPQDSIKLFKMDIPHTMPPIGTDLSIIPLTIPQETVQTASPQAALIAPAQLGVFMMPDSQWGVLNETQQALVQIAPQAAANMAAITPSPANPAQLPAAAMLFLSILRGGDLSGWLGEKSLETLKANGRGGLLSKIEGESSTLARTAAQPALQSMAQDWRSVNMPMLWHGEYHKAMLSFRHDRDPDQGQQGGGKQTRFLFDLKIPSMGKIQIDGLVRMGRLDLILRTQQSFSKPMQMEMRDSFADALRQVGFTGELSFQDDPKKWVTIATIPNTFGAEA